MLPTKIGLVRRLFPSSMGAMALVLLTNGVLSGDLQDCASPNPSVRIQACSSIIGLGRETPFILSGAYNNRGTAYKLIGQPDRAMSDYEMAIKINPKNTDALINIGTINYENGQYDIALNYYDKAVKANPVNAAAYTDRGLVLKTQGQIDRSLRDFDKAISIDPQFAPAYIHRGDAHRLRMEFDLAFSDLNKAISLTIAADAFVNRGLVYVDTGDFNKAMHDYGTAISIEPNSALAYNDRSIVQEILGQLENALADAEKAYALLPNESSPLLPELKQRIARLESWLASPDSVPAKREQAPARPEDTIALEMAPQMPQVASDAKVDLELQRIVTAATPGSGKQIYDRISPETQFDEPTAPENLPDSTSQSNAGKDAESPREATVLPDSSKPTSQAPSPFLEVVPALLEVNKFKYQWPSIVEPGASIEDGATFEFIKGVVTTVLVAGYRCDSISEMHGGGNPLPIVFISHLFDDPDGNISILNPYGVSFGEFEHQLVHLLQLGGDLVKAQKFVAAKLKPIFGDSSAIGSADRKVLTLSCNHGLLKYDLYEPARAGGLPVVQWVNTTTTASPPNDGGIDGTLGTVLAQDTCNKLNGILETIIQQRDKGTTIEDLKAKWGLTQLSTSLGRQAARNTVVALIDELYRTNTSLEEASPVLAVWCRDFFAQQAAKSVGKPSP